MPRICSVVFRGGGRVYQFSAGALELAPGDGVVVDTTRGADFGRVVKGPDEVGGDTRLLTSDGDLRTFPSHWLEHGGMDGFYAARLTRR